MSSRLSYLLRRLLLAIPTFLGITLVCFALTRILPGGPVEMRLARLRGIGGAEGASGRVASVTAEQRDELNRQFGFDRPFAVQYGRWLFHDAMGLRMPSYDYPERTAGELIASRFPVSIWFGITGFVLKKFTQFGQSLILNLTNTFTGSADFPADIFQRLRRSPVQTETHFQDHTFAVIKFTEQFDQTAD